MIPSDQSLDSFRFLARLLGEATLRTEERARATHGRFNVFTTLLSSDDEARLHTRFLHALLNPAGLHDCGPLFLNLFLETLREVPPMESEESPIAIDSFPQDWNVYKEASRPPHGSIDLLLERKGTGVAIENKIFAREQPQQLARYAEYLAGRYPDKGQRLLLYLTRFGDAATTHGNKPYFRISYREHILHWLEKCLRETYAFLPINQALLQYRAVVRQVIEQPNDPEIMEDATEFVMKNPEIIRFRSTISRAADLALERFVDRLGEAVGLHFSTEYSVNLHTGQRSFGSAAEGTLYLAPKSGHPLHQAPFSLAFQWWKLRKQLLFGIEHDGPIPEERRGIFERMNGVLHGCAEGDDFKAASPGFPAWPTGWWVFVENLSDDVLANEIERPSELAPERICARIEVIIDLLANAYRKSLAPRF